VFLVCVPSDFKKIEKIEKRKKARDSTPATKEGRRQNRDPSQSATSCLSAGLSICLFV
jgi:hypothetical protein